MKKINTSIKILVAFLATSAIWLSSIFWVPKLADYLQKEAGCATTVTQNDIKTSETKIDCGSYLTKLGTTGDLFGAVNSLFTGLALFAVAITLWIDSQARRESLKPLVTSVADKDFFIIDKPRITPVASLKLTMNPQISNIVSDPALNVSIDAKIFTKTSSHLFPTKIYETPLANGVTIPIEIEETIEGDFLLNLLADLTESNGVIRIKLNTNYENLEQIRWCTEVSYILELYNTQDIAKLNAIREKNPDFVNIWDNSAVAFRSTVVTGSWKRFKL